jgi:hypothetical protein
MGNSVIERSIYAAIAMFLFILFGVNLAKVIDLFICGIAPLSRLSELSIVYAEPVGCAAGTLMGILFLIKKSRTTNKSVDSECPPSQ